MTQHAATPLIVETRSPNNAFGCVVRGKVLAVLEEPGKENLVRFAVNVDDSMAGRAAGVKTGMCETVMPEKVLRYVS